jgi:hypothetical protein
MAFPALLVTQYHQQINQSSHSTAAKSHAAKWRCHSCQDDASHLLRRRLPAHRAVNGLALPGCAPATPLRRLLHLLAAALAQRQGRPLTDKNWQLHSLHCWQPVLLNPVATLITIWMSHEGDIACSTQVGEPVTGSLGTKQPSQPEHALCADQAPNILSSTTKALLESHPTRLQSGS